MFWQRVRGALGLQPDRRRPPTVSERFALFREIGSANDQFLERLAELMEKGDGTASRRMGTTRAIYESLTAPIGTMVRALASMSGGRYRDLVDRYETLDRQFRAELLNNGRQETGPLVVTADLPPDAFRPDLVGPKTARLAEVAARAGLHVPPFFAVTVSGYRRFMSGTGLHNVVAATLWCADLGDRQQLRDACEKCRAAVEAARLPVDLEESMRQAFRSLREKHSGQHGVAVRSSATVEDSESSFAGQFESVLNVTEDGLAQAYKQVVASKYRFEAVQYAVARGFLDDDVAMPVLVMAMVQPKAAGVAYSRDAEHPDCSVVTAVRGLAQPLVDGRVIPDRFVISRTTPAKIVEMSLGPQTLQLRCAEGGGLEELSQDERDSHEASIEPEMARRIAHAAGGLERHFGEPQDVEWALDENGDLLIVQTRPLHAAAHAEESEGGRGLVEGYRILARAAIRVSGGTASGRVHRVADPTNVVDVPNDSVLVVPHTSPRLAAFMGSVSAIVAASGSPTGHMATVAREFGVPCLVGIETPLASLQEGAVVTVDAWTKVVYEGEVPEILRSQPARAAKTGARRDPLRESAERLLSRVAPLTLTDPESPEFVPANCQTLHDFARFVHQRAMIEMFEIQTLSLKERRQTRRLAWKVPMDVVLLDLGGGVEPDGGFRVPVEKVVSVPLCALIEGMTDPRLRWSGPVGFDLKGFMSVVVRSAADDQRYGEPSYAICSRDYVHFSSRLAYHFATVDSVCGSSVNENYARFLFHGGAAISARRGWRAHFLAKVLQGNGFAVKLTGDRVEAVLAKRAAEVLEETLVMLGRLMVASRHLDMLMESSATAEVFARAFLSGDFGFETVRNPAT